MSSSSATFKPSTVPYFNLQNAKDIYSTKRKWGSNNWDNYDGYFSRPTFPECNYNPTGALSFELERCYTLGSNPRRSFRDAKIQHLEQMVGEIAVGVVVLAAAKKADRVRRDIEARQREESRQRRIQVLHANHVEGRRGTALDQILEELAALDRLRRLMSNLRSEQGSANPGRVAEFLAFAGCRLTAAEAAHSAAGLEARLEKSRLFDADDDYNFYPPTYC